MAQESTVAPKERINIAYKSENGQAEENIELPFKMLVAGDFTSQSDDRLVEERKPVNIDKDNFNEVLLKHDVKAEFTVANKLVDASDDEDASLGVSLQFNSMKDFSPDNIVRQVPELKALVELREALVALKGPLGNVPAFRKMIEATLQDEEMKDRILRELNLLTDPVQEEQGS